MLRTSLSAELVRRLLDYNPETGLFTRREASGYNGCHAAGREVGCIKRDGYVYIGVAGERHLAHRIAWLHVHGEWPAVIDHINGVRSDNRLSNLRSVTQRTNVQNVRTCRSNSQSGLLGAVYMPRRKVWTSQIYINGKNTWLGYFATAQEAHAAHVAAKRLHHEGNML